MKNAGVSSVEVFVRHGDGVSAGLVNIVSLQYILDLNQLFHILRESGGRNLIAKTSLFRTQAR